MGWGSAGGYFDTVADALIEGEASDELKTRVCSVLIGVFRGDDWDTHRDSLDQYADDPAIVAAFAEHDIFLACGADDPNDLYTCALDDGHDSLHDDGNGHRWRDYRAGELIADARALAQALLNRLRDFVSDGQAFGEALSWETMPDWLTDDGLGRALWAHGAEETETEGA
jgi:hypothetical protein